jgi:hypothetical protein
VGSYSVDPPLVKTDGDFSVGSYSVDPPLVKTDGVPKVIGSGVGVLAANSQSTSKSGYWASLWDP